MSPDLVEAASDPRVHKSLAQKVKMGWQFNVEEYFSNWYSSASDCLPNLSHQ